MQQGQSGSVWEQWQVSAEHLMLDRQQSLAAMTMVFTSRLSSALESWDTSTSTDITHSKQKTKAYKKNHRGAPWGQWLSLQPEFQNSDAPPLVKCWHLLHKHFICWNSMQSWGNKNYLLLFKQQTGKLQAKPVCVSITHTEIYAASVLDEWKC